MKAYTRGWSNCMITMLKHEVMRQPQCLPEQRSYQIVFKIDNRQFCLTELVILIILFIHSTTN